MLKLGQYQKLTIVKKVEFGVYLAEEQDMEKRVLLPAKQVPENAKTGDELEVFLYKDSKDRLISTTNEPKLELGGLAVLKVAQVGKIGAFLDWGLEKDLLLPFKEQTARLRPGDDCLAALYVDKSSRLAATMKVYSHMSSESPYQKDDKVTGTVYEINENLGVFVAVADHYFGLIPNRELYGKCRLGEVLKVRVTKVREDGKLDLSLREVAYRQMNADAEAVLARLKEKNGVLPFNDRVEPEIIRREFNLSKNAFKRAVGHLLKEGRVEVNEDSIRLK